MTSSIKFTALSGADDETALCYLLEIDNCKLLLDCGWNEALDPKDLELLKPHLPSIDAVLISYPDLEHLGALPYAYGKLGLSCPCYSTQPVYKMGQMFMYDIFQSKSNAEGYSEFTLDDVDQAFEKFIQLKYSQRTGLTGKGLGTTITPYAAGHMIGGTIWKIEKESEEIVYAVDFNHKKERHLNGTVLESLERPTLLITDSKSMLIQPVPRKQKDQELISKLLQTLQSGGNVLLPIDTAGRVLELCQLLDHAWSFRKLSEYPLILLNHVSYNVIEFAKSQLEWMSDSVMKIFEVSRDNPFSFKHITFAHSLADLEKLPKPRVIMTSLEGLSTGYSLELFKSLFPNPKNLVLFTNRPNNGTLSHRLLNEPDSKKFQVDFWKRVLLEGDELQEALETRRQEKEALLKQEMEEKEKKRKIALMDLSDESGDEENIISSDGMIRSGKQKRDIVLVNTLGMRTTTSGGYFKRARTFPMFPCLEDKTKKWDDYGEHIKPEDFIPRTVDLSNPNSLHAVVEGTHAHSSQTGPPTTNPSSVPNVNDPSNKNTDSEMDSHQEDAPPAKYCLESKTILVEMQREFMDFEGRSDGRSIKVILGNIQPRQIIVIHGNKSSTTELIEYCQTASELKNMTNIIAPEAGECIDLTSERDIYQVKLKDSLVSSLAFSKFLDYELAYVDGTVDMENIDPLSVDSGSKPDAESATPVLSILPPSEIHGHKQVFIGKLMLSDFKQILTKAGFKADFSGGALICNDIIAVKKDPTGNIRLEGSFCREYFFIRDLLYHQYAII